jgi:hypothetical protein
VDDTKNCVAAFGALQFKIARLPPALPGVIIVIPRNSAGQTSFGADFPDLKIDFSADHRKETLISCNNFLFVFKVKSWFWKTSKRWHKYDPRCNRGLMGLLKSQSPEGGDTILYHPLRGSK